jgi:excisionase family DNA binding protein
MGIAKFEIRRKCMVCGEPFMAKTVESWYCSPRCSKIAYKRRRDEEIRHSKLDVIVRKIPKSQEYVKVSEAYALFGISKDTLYRLIRKGKIPYVNAGKKMIRVSNGAVKVSGTKPELLEDFAFIVKTLREPIADADLRWAFSLAFKSDDELIDEIAESIFKEVVGEIKAKVSEAMVDEK